MSKKPRAAAATAAAAMAASSADELDDYMRRVEIVGSLLDLNGEAREIDAPRLCRRARCLSVARHRCVAAAAPAVTACARRPVTLCPRSACETASVASVTWRSAGLCPLLRCYLSVCLSAVCLSAVCVPPACWLTAQQSRCATHRSAAHEGCNKNRTQRAQPFRHRPAAAPDRAGRVMACAPLGCPR
jgi:hypothetical protein